MAHCRTQLSPCRLLSMAILARLCNRMRKQQGVRICQSKKRSRPSGRPTWTPSIPPIWRRWCPFTQATAFPCPPVWRPCGVEMPFASSSRAAFRQCRKTPGSSSCPVKYVSGTAGPLNAASPRRRMFSRWEVRYALRAGSRRLLAHRLDHHQHGRASAATVTAGKRRPLPSFQG